MGRFGWFRTLVGVFKCYLSIQLSIQKRLNLLMGVIKGKK